MSTYTNYTIKARENLSRIRNPGCSDDGLSPERVIFSNPDNIYYGTFAGTIKNEDRDFENCNLSNCTINGGQMNDVEVFYDGQQIDLPQIADQLSAVVSGIAELSSSRENLSNEINKLENNVSCLSNIVLSNNNSVISLSGDILKMSSDIDKLSSSTSSLSSDLYGFLDNTLPSIELSIQNIISNPSLETLSNYLTGLVESSMADIVSSIDSISSSLSAALSDEISARQLSDEHFASLTDTMSQQISVLSVDNKKIWESLRGSLNFKAVVSASDDFNDVSSFLVQNFIEIYDCSPTEAEQMQVLDGYYYIVNGIDKSRSYSIGGLTVQNNDWIIANQNFIVLSATSSVFSRLDAQDANNAKTDSDNVFTGNNEFQGLVEATEISAQSLSVQLSSVINEDGSTLESALQSKAQYLGTFQNNGSSTSLTSELYSLMPAGASKGIRLCKGAFARSANGGELNDTFGIGHFVGKNDYIVLKEPKELSNITWSDIDFIRDAEIKALALSNGISSLSALLAEENEQLESVTKDLSTFAVKSMHYYGDLVTDGDDSLCGCIQHTYGVGQTVSAGSMNRIPNSISVPDFLGNIIELNENDYIIFKNSISTVSAVTSADFDIVRDAQAEVARLSGDISALSDQISPLDDRVKSLESADIDMSVAVDQKIFIDGLSAQSLSAIHISQDEFFQKVVTSSILSNELYIVSSEYINAYGQRIENLAEPELSTDAATRGYVDNADSSISGQLSGLISVLYDNLEHIAADSIISSLEQKSCISNVICAVVGIRDTLIDLRQTLSTMLGF